MSHEAISKLDERVHADAVLGKDKSFPRAMAINLLPSSAVPHPAELLRKVLENESEEPKLRRLAAVGLWRVNTEEACGHLLKAAETSKDATTLISVVKCLGRVGDERALRAIEAIRRTAHGVLAEQASFAAVLISHRLGLDGNELPVPTQYVNMPSSGAQRLEFLAPATAEAELFADCLAQEPFGIELSKESLLHFGCPGERWMVGFNRDIGAGAVEALLHRKTLMGILAGKDGADGRYPASHLILSAPRTEEGKAYIFINRITGEPAWAGSTTSIAADSAEFAIRTVGRMGIVPMEIQGSFMANGEVRIASASTAGRVSEKRRFPL